MLVAPQMAWAQPTNNNPLQVLCFGTVEPYCVDCTENGNTGTAGSTYVWTVSTATATIQPNPAFPAVQANPLQGNHILIDWGTTPVGNYTLQVVETNADGCAGLPVILDIQIQQVTATAIANPVLCNGGTATVTVSAAGGTGPYTGTGTFTVDAGTFEYIVSDVNGCADTVEVTVTEPSAPLTASATATPAGCNGAATGSVTLTVGGGTSPYTYAWSNGAITQNLTGVVAGTYNVTITDANGCTQTASATVSEPPALTASASSTPAGCNGALDGTVTLTVGGGTSPYTYAWSNGAITQNLTGVASGTYNVTITDANGCTQTASATVSEPPALTASATATPAGCNGAATGSVTLTVGGGTSPYTYAWSNGAITQNLTGVVAGTYNVTITDANGCTQTASATITEPQPFTVDVTAGPQICYQGSAIFTFSGGPANGTVNITVDGVAQTITLDASGNYTLVVDPATSNVDVDVISVSDGTCTYDVNDSGTVIVSPEIVTSPISHD